MPNGVHNGSDIGANWNTICVLESLLAAMRAPLLLVLEFADVPVVEANFVEGHGAFSLDTFNMPHHLTTQMQEPTPRPTMIVAGSR